MEFAIGHHERLPQQHLGALLVQQRDVLRHRRVGRDLGVRVGRTGRALRRLVEIELAVVPGSDSPTIHAVRLKFWLELESVDCDAGTKPSETVKTCWFCGCVSGSEYTWYCGAMRAGVVETSWPWLL